jgi:hypothetical protein
MNLKKLIYKIHHSDVRFYPCVRIQVSNLTRGHFFIGQVFDQDPGGECGPSLQKIPA